MVRCIGGIFHIYWRPEDLAAAPNLLDWYRRSVRIIKASADGDEFASYADGDYRSDTEVGEQLKQPFESLMRKLASAPSTATPPRLHDYLYPEWFLLEATIAEDGETIRPRRIETTRSPYLLPGEYTRSGAMTWVKNWYSSRQVELVPAHDFRPEHPLLHNTPTRVLVDGDTACFFKGFGPGYRGTTRELAFFQKLNDAISRKLVPSDLRVCRLHGLVRDTDDDTTTTPTGPRSRLIGMLLNYIPPKHPGILGTLEYVAPYVDAALRRRWADDIEAAVGSLHLAGCIWGDAKAENVLVDSTDNVWLIDFGGGFTNGWVDAEQRETERGDLGAVQKLRAWLEGLE